MAYSNNPLDGTSVSILVQVAFKGAIEVSKNADGQLDPVAFADNLPILTDALIDEVKARVPAPTTATPKKAATFNAEQSLADEMGATPAPSGGEIKVLGEQHGPLPEWFVTAAATKGVTKVFDNRKRREETGKNFPWFVTPKDAEKYGEPNDVPFWPPRKAG